CACSTMLFLNNNPFMCANLTLAAPHDLVQSVPNCSVLLPLNKLPSTTKLLTMPPASVAPPLAPKAVEPLFTNTDDFKYEPGRGFEKLNAPAAFSMNAASSTRFGPLPPR